MSTLTADITNMESSEQPPMEAVVVNSIIYSKPSFCTLAIALGDVPFPKNKMASSSKPKRENEPNSSKLQTDINLNHFCTNLSVPPPPPDAKVYRICTTINGSIHHQISDMCDNILAMAGFFSVDNNDHDHDDDDDNESVVDFGFRDDYNLGVGDDLNNDDEEEDYEDDEDQVDYESENLSDEDDDDVVDFLYESPFESAPKLNCVKKKKVSFDTKPTVHLMHTWNYAYRKARKGEWEVHARDRERFKLRVQRAALILDPILESEHRQKIYKKRFSNLYGNDEEDLKTTETQETEVTADVKDPAEKAKQLGETSINEPKKPHQKKKRRKKRFCKMGNKHYF